MMKHGQRSRHSHDAKFLKQNPPALPFRAKQEDMCQKTKNKMVEFSSNTIKKIVQQSFSSMKTPDPFQLQQQTLDHDSVAPKKHPDSKDVHTAFTTVLRKTTRRKNIVHSILNNIIPNKLLINQRNL